MEVWTLPRDKRSYAAEDAVELLVDSVLTDAVPEDSVLADPLLSLVLFVSLLSELFSESFLLAALSFALPLRP